jgi:hypothetical protein
MSRYLDLKEKTMEDILESEATPLTLKRLIKGQLENDTLSANFEIIMSIFDIPYASFITILQIENAIKIMAKKISREDKYRNKYPNLKLFTTSLSMKFVSSEKKDATSCKKFEDVIDAIKKDRFTTVIPGIYEEILQKIATKLEDPELMIMILLLKTLEK